MISCMKETDKGIIFTTELSEPGGRRVPWPTPNILADQLTLFKPGGSGHIMHNTLIPAPQDFQTFQRPCLKIKGVSSLNFSSYINRI